MLVRIVDQFLDTPPTRFGTRKHCGELIGFPDLIVNVKVVHQGEDLQVRSSRSDELGDGLFGPGRIGVIFALLAKLSVGVFKMQELADQNVEVLDVLFKRTHAGLIPGHVEADIELVN